MVEYFFETTVSKKTKIFIKIPFFISEEGKGEKNFSVHQKKSLKH